MIPPSRRIDNDRFKIKDEQLARFRVCTALSHVQVVRMVANDSVAPTEVLKCAERVKLKAVTGEAIVADEAARERYLLRYRWAPSP
jgi:hypothetical protein